MAEKSEARRGSSESNDPLLMKLSTTRRLTARRSTRSQKSKSAVKRPPCRLAVSTASTAPSPTFLIAASPKRMPESSITVKNMSESFTSGGRTRMPRSRHSPMYCTILSVLARSEVRRAAMKNAG